MGMMDEQECYNRVKFVRSRAKRESLDEKAVELKIRSLMATFGAKVALETAAAEVDDGEDSPYSRALLKLLKEADGNKQTPIQ